MKKFYFFIILSFVVSFFLIPSPLIAQNNGQALTSANSQAAILTAFANETITVDATSGGVAFTALTINPTCTDCIPFSRAAQRADCTTESQTGINIRATITGTAPTTTVGTLITSGTTFTVFGYTNISAFRAIRTAGTSVVMFCTYSRN